MAQEPFRFIHAARLWLDHPLRDTGPLPPELRSITEEASLTAFARVIDACLAHDVDFLLLSGNSFHQHDQGLRGQVALVRGCERLAEREIPVFLVAGPTDPWPAWLPGLRFPENVHRLGLDADSPAPLTRDGKPLATVYGVSAADLLPGVVDENPETAWSHLLPEKPEGRFAIALLPTEQPPLAGCRFDYWALGGGTSRKTTPVGRGLAHDPASPQGFSPQETGPRGCTLVEVDAAGAMRQTLIPAAPVRWEEFSFAITPLMQRSDLLAAMRASLASLGRNDTEKLWLVAWRIHGDGPLRESLSDEQARAELIAALQADTGVPKVAVHTHALHLSRSEIAAPSFEENRLAAEYAGLITEHLDPPHWSLQRCLAHSSLRGGPWEHRLETLAEELDPDAIREEVWKSGHEWLADG